MYACLIPGKGALDKGPVLAVIYTVIVVAASAPFLHLNDHGWESNRLLAIGIGGGMGWVMMLNVWGVIWRTQKRLFSGPPTTRRMARPCRTKQNIWRGRPSLCRARTPGCRCLCSS